VREVDWEKGERLGSGTERKARVSNEQNKKTGHATEETKEGTMDENVFLVRRKRILRTRTSPIAILLVETRFTYVHQQLMLDKI
jgi:hypothetical protein